MLWQIATRIGLPVFPCGKHKKPCRGSNGFKDAQTHPQKIKQLFERYHWATLIGVPTGAISGIDALDLDTARHEQAIAFLRSISPVHTRTHQTQSGGFHFLFAHKPGRNNTAGTKQRKGVDIRGDGGYIIWWPAAGYAVNPLDIIEWPDNILARFEPSKRYYKTDGPWEISEERLAKIVREVSCAREGTRNDKLFVSSCRVGEWIKARTLPRDYGERVLLGAALACGLDQVSSEKTIASGFKAAGV